MLKGSRCIDVRLEKFRIVCGQSVRKPPESLADISYFLVSHFVRRRTAQRYCPGTHCQRPLNDPFQEFPWISNFTTSMSDRILIFQILKCVSCHKATHGVGNKDKGDVSIVLELFRYAFCNCLAVERYRFSSHRQGSQPPDRKRP